MLFLPKPSTPVPSRENIQRTLTEDSLPNTPPARLQTAEVVKSKESLRDGHSPGEAEEM